jgi:hypothetical protein
MMRAHIILPATAAALLLLAGWAVRSHAQPPGVPNPYAIVSPTGEEIIRAENTGPSISTVKLTQVRDAGGYVILTGATAPTTGSTFQAPQDIGEIAEIGAAIANWTVLSPIAPNDGQRVQIFSSGGVSAAFNYTASGTQTVVGGSALTLAANGNVEFVYQLATNTWFRIQ